MGAAGIRARALLAGAARRAAGWLGRPEGGDPGGFPGWAAQPGAKDASFLWLPPSLLPAPGKSKEGLFSCQLYPS